jgi:hypothetical protein
MGVVSLQKFKEERSPHLQGRCRCMLCRYEWQGVAPVGTTWLECPKCGAEKGYFITETMPPEDALIWRCNCGNELFVIRPEGYAMCVNCGVSQSF